VFDSKAALAGHAESRNTSLNPKYDPISPEIALNLFQDMIEYNHFATSLHDFGSSENVQRILHGADCTKADQQTLVATINDHSDYFEIAAITSSQATGDKAIRFKFAEDHGSSSEINGTSELMEPLCYPIFFCHGENGWGVKIKNITKIAYIKYLCSLVLRPDKNWDRQEGQPRYMTMVTKSGEVVGINRFQYLSRLGQVYMVDMVSRAIDFRLDWHKHNQETIFGPVSITSSYAHPGVLLPPSLRPTAASTPLHRTLSSAYASAGSSSASAYSTASSSASSNSSNSSTPASPSPLPSAPSSSSVSSSSFYETQPGSDDGPVENDEDEEKGSFLSSSFHGSPRHLKQLANEALCVVSEIGNPHMFITVTCNHMWPEIQSELLPGQTAFDRPELVTRVFHQRTESLLGNLRSGVYFGAQVNVTGDGKYERTGHKPAYIMRVIEYQHRGLPHAHIVCRLENVPECPIARAVWSDGNWADKVIPNITAHLPEEFLNPQNEWESSINDYRACVKKHMVHKCSVSEINGCKKTSGDACKRSFPKPFNEGKTRFDDKGFPIYRRPNTDDSNIVAHCPLMLMDWDGHCNVEWAAGPKSVLYLYSYLFKG
jgi:hypothetical protein